MNDAPTAESKHRTRVSIRTYAWCGLCVALTGSVAVALVECTAAASVSLRSYGGDGRPWALLAAALGKAIASHVLVWCPLFVLVALGSGWLLRRRVTQAPEALLAGLFVALMGCVIAPVDLKLSERDTLFRMIIACVAGLVLAFGVYGVLRLWTRRRGRTPLARLLRGCAGLALLVAAGAVFAFIRSPLFNPGNYAVPSSTSQYPKPKRPHVLWVVMDTVRGDHTNMYGYSQPTTPRLAAFADGALVFDRAIANGIWTLPNHASMFSGRGLREHGTDFRHARLDAEFTTVAEILRDHGYATAAFSNNPWVAPDTEITRGFDTAGVIYHLRHVTRSSIGWMFERIGMPPPFPWLDEDFGGAMTNALTADWLDARARHDQPMFLFVNYMDAHLPYRVPARYRRMFLSPEQVRRSFALSLSAYGRIVDAVDRRFNFEDQSFFAMADREVLKGQYDAGIRYLDDRVSELLDMYRQRGLLDNTLVVITSDHGEYLDQHGQWAHRMQVYQDLLNVVIMLRPPGLVQGRRVETPVQLADLYATVIGATVGDSSASAREPSETFNRITWPARDLFAIAAEAPDPQRVAVSEYGSDAQANIQRVRERDDPALKRRALPQVAAQDARYKLMVTADGTQELFDVIADPREEHDLLTVFPEHAERLGRYLAQWHERVPQHQPPEAADPSDMDPDVIRALKSLGYLGDD